MTHSFRLYPAAVVLAIALIAVAPVAAQTFSAGTDGLNTMSGGSTQVDLASFPGAATALGSSIVGGTVVNLQGVSLGSGFGPSVDTVVTRGAIASGSGALGIIALNMASTSNVVLADGRQYKLQVCLSDTASPAGTISLTSTSGDGGTFNSSFQVIPKLVFTNASNPSDVLTVDCSVSGACNTLTVASSATGYAQTGGPNGFDPGSQGINTLPTGSQSVANCGGTHSVTINAPNGFYPGWTFTPGSSAAAGPGFRVTGMFDAARVTPSTAVSGTFRNTGTSDAHSASHKTLPPLDCRTAGFVPGSTAHPSTFAPSPISIAYCYAVAAPFHTID